MKNNNDVCIVGKTQKGQIEGSKGIKVEGDKMRSQVDAAVTCSAVFHDKMKTMDFLFRLKKLHSTFFFKEGFKANVRGLMRMLA